LFASFVSTAFSDDTVVAIAALTLGSYEIIWKSYW